MSYEEMTQMKLQIKVSYSPPNMVTVYEGCSGHCVLPFEFPSFFVQAPSTSDFHFLTKHNDMLRVCWVTLTPDASQSPESVSSGMKFTTAY